MLSCTRRPRSSIKKDPVRGKTPGPLLKEQTGGLLCCISRTYSTYKAYKAYKGHELIGA